MEGRKLALVPYKRWMEYHRWQEQRTPHLPPNPHLSEMSQLQHELQSLMDRQDLSETEKSQKYGQLLQRLQLFHQKALDETALPTLKDFKTLMKSPAPSPVPVPVPVPVTKTEKGEEEEEGFQTPPEKVRKLTTPPTSRIGWIKKMMATPSSSQEKKKVKTEVKTEVKQEPISPAQTSSSSTPIAGRTRKALQSKKIPQEKKSSILQEWVSY